MTATRFAAYALLRKLNRDALGDCYRARNEHRGEPRDIVLLRKLNGEHLSPGVFMAAMERQRGPRAKAEDSGVRTVAGIPYVTSDYTPGRTLEEVLVRSSKLERPVPLALCLGIVRDLCWELCKTMDKGLFVPPGHGFLVPQLVRITSEGMILPEGHEAGPGLRACLANVNFRRTFSAYLAPESQASAAPRSAADVYALGSLLLQLVTARPLPRSPAELRELLAQPLETGAGEPVPEEVQELLGRSLVAEQQRIGSTRLWHENVNAAMHQANLSAVKFDLACFMHSLFDDDLAEDEREHNNVVDPPMERLTLVVNTPAPASGPPPRFWVDSQKQIEPPAPPRLQVTEALLNRRALSVTALAVLVLVGGLFYTALQESSEADERPPQVQNPLGETPKQAQPERLRPRPDSPARDAKAVDRSQDDEESATAGTDVSSRPPHDAKPRPPPQGTEHTGDLKDAGMDQTLAPSDSVENRSVGAHSPAAGAAGHFPPRDNHSPSPPPPLESPVPEPSGSSQTPIEGRQGEPPDLPPPQNDTPPPAKSRLPRPTLDFSPPKLVKNPALRYPLQARRINKEAVVTLRVLVDLDGTVVETAPASGEASGYGFDEAAREAAGRAIYQPAVEDGEYVRMWTILELAFRLR